MSKYTLETWAIEFEKKVRQEIPEIAFVDVSDGIVTVDGCVVWEQEHFRELVEGSDTYFGVLACDEIMSLCVDNSILKLKGWYYWLDLCEKRNRDIEGMLEPILAKEKKTESEINDEENLEIALGQSLPLNDRKTYEVRKERQNEKTNQV